MRSLARRMANRHMANRLWQIGIWQKDIWQNDVFPHGGFPRPQSEKIEKCFLTHKHYQLTVGHKTLLNSVWHFSPKIPNF